MRLYECDAALQTKSAYRRALVGIVNPIGCADDRPGFSPADLAGYLCHVSATALF